MKTKKLLLIIKKDLRGVLKYLQVTKETKKPEIETYGFMSLINKKKRGSND